MCISEVPFYTTRWNVFCSQGSTTFLFKGRMHEKFFMCLFTHSFRFTRIKRSLKQLWVLMGKFHPDLFPWEKCEAYQYCSFYRSSFVVVSHEIRKYCFDTFIQIHTSRFSKKRRSSITIKLRSTQNECIRCFWRVHSGCFQVEI